MKRGGVLWMIALAGVVGFLLTPVTHNALLAATRAHPLAMGFLKFTILATLGELLGLRMTAGEWKLPVGLSWRMLVWGIIGSLIALMFPVFNAGAQAVMNIGMLPGKGTPLQTLAVAFWTSTLMNITFAPAMMAGHRFSDAWIELSHGRILSQRVRFSEMVAYINWQSFFTFVIGTTIPFIWIPAHTLTFLAPADYRVLIAAFLSVLFGIVLSYAARDRNKARGSALPELEREGVSIAG